MFTRELVIGGIFPVFKIRRGETEAFHCAGQFDRDVGAGKFFEQFDAGTTFTQTAHDIGAVIADAGDESEAGDDDALHAGGAG